jgi:hypothetical protein
VRPGGWLCEASSSSAHSLKDDGQLGLELIESAVVADGICRSARLFVLRELARGAFADRVVPARLCACVAHLLVGDDRDRGVVDAVHPGFEQQRRLDDGRARGRLAPLDLITPAGDAQRDERPEQALEPRALGRIGERAARDLLAVDDAAGRDLVAPAGDDRVADLVARVEIVDDRVGRERCGAEALERLERGRLA